MKLPSHLTALLALVFACGAHAATVWDESADGDLSNDPDAPTAVDLQIGSNLILGDMVSPSDTRDFFTFSIEAGEQLSAIFLQEYVDLDTGGPGDRGFIAINEGDTSYIPNGQTAGLFLGGAHLDPDIGTDLLVLLAGAPQAGQGFTPPLGPGTYSMVVQQTGPELTGYTLDFVIERTVIPLPAGLWLLASGVIALGGVARRRRSA